MRATLANLEKEENGIAEDFTAGFSHGHSMRQHLSNIRSSKLYEAVDDCDNFEQYVKLERLPIGRPAAYMIAKQGEVEGYLELSTSGRFSGKALSKLGTLRLENPDGTKSHDLDVRKVKRVAKKSLSLANGENVTPKIVKKAIAECYGEKPPKQLGEQLQNKIGSVNAFRRAIEQLPEEALTDANVQYSGVVKRLAKAYSDVASQLRKGL